MPVKQTGYLFTVYRPGTGGQVLSPYYQYPTGRRRSPHWTQPAVVDRVFDRAGRQKRRAR
jgi:hypothetical protein